MAIERPPLLDLAGLDDDDAYLKARKEFVERLLSRPIIDPLGRRVLFRHGYKGGPEQAQFAGFVESPSFDAMGRIEDDCHHVCFKEADRNPLFSRLPRDVFRPDRAAHIPYIMPTLIDLGTNIHECSHDGKIDRQSYTLFLPGVPRAYIPNHFFFVLVSKLPNPDEVSFITAYALENQAKMDAKRKLGPRIYPAKKPDEKKGGSSKQRGGGS